MCIYFLHYEYTSYTLVMCLDMSQLCGDDNHDVPRHVQGMWEGKLMFLEVSAGQYLFLLSLSLILFLCACCSCVFCAMLQSFWKSIVVWYVKWVFFIAGVNHSFKKIFLVFLAKRKYQIPSKILTKLSDSFYGFLWALQTVAGMVPWISSGPLLLMSFPCHHLLSSSYSLLCSLSFLMSLNKPWIQTQQQCPWRLPKYVPTKLLGITSQRFHKFHIHYIQNIISHISLIFIWTLPPFHRIYYQSLYCYFFLQSHLKTWLCT